MEKSAYDTGSVGTAFSLTANQMRNTSFSAIDNRDDSRCNLYDVEEDENDKNDSEFTNVLIRTPQNLAYDRSVREATKGMIRLQNKQTNSAQPLLTEKNDNKAFITHSLSNNEKSLSKSNIILTTNKFNSKNIVSFFFNFKLIGLISLITIAKK